jgi:hypothetical protein
MSSARRDGALVSKYVGALPSQTGLTPDSGSLTTRLGGPNPSKPESLGMFMVVERQARVSETNAVQATDAPGMCMRCTRHASVHVDGNRTRALTVGL